MMLAQANTAAYVFAEEFAKKKRRAQRISNARGNELKKLRKARREGRGARSTCSGNNSVSSEFTIQTWDETFSCTAPPSSGRSRLCSSDSASESSNPEDAAAFVKERIREQLKRRDEMDLLMEHAEKCAKARENSSNKMGFELAMKKMKKYRSQRNLACRAIEDLNGLLDDVGSNSHNLDCEKKVFEILARPVVSVNVAPTAAPAFDDDDSLSDTSHNNDGDDMDPIAREESEMIAKFMEEQCEI